MMLQRTKTYKKEHRTGRVLFSLACVFMLLLVLKNSEIAIDYVTQGLELSLTSVIPSLFPFMVISELIVKSGAASVLSKPIRRLANFLFGISEEGASVFLLGALCGFPIGARCAARLYDDGRIDKEEFVSLMDFSNNPSSAFVISAVGVSLYGNRRLGLLLYVITLLSAISVGIVRNFGRKRKREEKSPSSRAQVKGISVSDFTDAVASGALGVINVSAFVTFFCVVVGTVGAVLDSLGVPGYVRALIFSAVEMTGGASAASALTPAPLAALACAFCLGWSGISVHCQVLSLCGARVNATRYVISKFMQGIFSTVYLWLYLELFGNKILVAAESVTAAHFKFSNSARCVILVLFIASLFVALMKKYRIYKLGFIDRFTV